jgi:cold shock CspA family protein
MVGEDRIFGSVSWWNDKRCTGYLRPLGATDRSRDVFCHFGSFTGSGLPLPSRGDRFEFRVRNNRRTRKPEAFDLRPIASMGDR